MKATSYYAKQGAGYGYTDVKGLNALIATVSSPTCAPVIVATRLRRSGSNSARGAGVAPCGIVVLRADSALYSADVINAARRGGARFSITARHDPAVVGAIASIGEDAWVPIRYSNAIADESEQRYISDAEVAEIPPTAFTSRAKGQQVTAG